MSNKKIVVEDKDLISSLKHMKSIGMLKERKNSINFESVKEAEDNAKEDVISALNEKLNFLKGEISEIRKGGYDLSLEGIKLLEVPLKIVVWKATCSVDDLKKIISIFDVVEPRVKEYREKYDAFLKEKEEKEAEKERLEKEKEDKKNEDSKVLDEKKKKLKAK